MQAALKQTGFADALKKLGLNEGKGSDGAGFNGKSRVSRLPQLWMARYDGKEYKRQSNKDGKGCTDIFNEWKKFNTSGDKAVPGVGDDVDEKETNNTITSLNKLNNNPNLVTDLGSCDKESSHQDVTITLTIVKIRSDISFRIAFLLVTFQVLCLLVWLVPDDSCRGENHHSGNIIWLIYFTIDFSIPGGDNCSRRKTYC